MARARGPSDLRRVAWSLALASGQPVGEIERLRLNHVPHFTQDSLNKADDFNDHLDTLANLTTPAFASHLHDVAFGLSDIGLSAPQVAAAATSFASLATAMGVSEPKIESITPKLLDVAEAIHLKTGKTVDEVITDIGKAAGGNKKSVADLGVVIDKTLNPDEQITSILDQLVGLYGDAKSAADDLHGTQEKINAKVDNFETKLGEALDGPLNDMAGVGLIILDELADWPGAVQDLLSPLARARDIFDDILTTVGLINQTPLTGAAAIRGREPGPGRGAAGSGNGDQATIDALNRKLRRAGLPGVMGTP
jgi:hypothetical protein